MPATFKTFNIKFRLALEGLGSSADVALASLYGTWAIVLPTEPEEDSTVPRILYTLTTSVGVTVPQSTNKRHRFWMKNYSENEGVLEQLEALGIVRRTGDYHKQGFVNFPAVEICLEEPEIVHACGSHFEENSVMDAKLEILGAKRHPWCSKCKQVYYCDAECQNKHWKIHGKECGEANPGEGMDNRRRAEMESFMSQPGFQTFNLGGN